MDRFSRFSLFALASGVFFLAFQMRDAASALEKINKSVLCLDSALVRQTHQHSWIAKTYMKPVLPPCWDYLSSACSTCGSKREDWDIPQGEEHGRTLEE